MTKQQKPEVKQVPSRLKDGTIVGYITVYWSAGLNKYVTVPSY